MVVEGENIEADYRIQSDDSEKRPSCMDKQIFKVTVRTWLQLLAVVIVVAVLLGLFAYFHSDISDFVNGPMKRFVKKLGWIGPIVYASIYAAATVLFIPGSVLTIAAGVIFKNLGSSAWVGLIIAFATVSVGSTVGAALAFLCGRFFFRGWVQRKIEEMPKFQAVERAIQKNGFYIVFLLRLSPIFPFNVLNYALGATTVQFWAYVLASWIGMGPGTFLYVYIGWAATSAASAKATGTTKLVEEILTYGVGAVATILAVVLVTWLGKRAIDKEMQENRVDGENEKLLSDDAA